MTDPDKPSFEAALAELKAIVDDIEGGELPIDALAPRVERASVLIRTCRGILTSTEARVGEAVAALTAALDED